VDRLGIEFPGIFEMPPNDFVRAGRGPRLPNADHIPPRDGVAGTHIVRYLAEQQQVLLYLDAWVRDGTAPPALRRRRARRADAGVHHAHVRDGQHLLRGRAGHLPAGRRRRGPYGLVQNLDRVRVVVR